jgi:predicted DNA-binding protein YlxM (UPF0122 family)
MGQRLSPKRAAELLDAYGSLLTARQREVASLVYEQDWSLAEVAAHYQVSRAAALDAVTRAGRQLEQWEEAVGLVAHQEKAAVMVAELERILSQVERSPARTEALGILARLARLEGMVSHV